MDIVLVHGHGQTGAGWQRVAEILERRGHRAFAPDRPQWTAADYARRVRERVDADRPVVVGHSGAGNLLPAFASAFDARRLVWFAAVVPDLAGGSSFREEVEAHRDEIYTDECLGWYPLDDSNAVDAYFLFHDCNLEQLRFGLTTLGRFQPDGVLDERPAPQELPPSTYILLRHDRIIRPEYMRRIARDRLGVEPVEIDGGHCAQIANAEVVAGLLS